MPRLNHLRIRYLLGFLPLGFLPYLSFGIANAQTNSGTTNTNTPTQEVIQNYESKIKVRQDGRLKVTETITIRNTEGGEIKRGIYRYFPNSDLKVTSVKRDGDHAMYRTEFNDGRKGIEIWKKDVYLDPGTYTYQIQYLTDQQIKDQGRKDQLYWNITGYDWSVPIRQLEAQVILPKQIPSDKITLLAFTGNQKKRGESYQANLEGNKAKFTITRTLQQSEGLRIVVNFPAGFVKSVESIENTKITFPSTIWELIALIIILLIFVVLSGCSAAGKVTRRGISSTNIGYIGGDGGGDGGGGDGGGGDGGGDGGC